MSRDQRGQQEQSHSLHEGSQSPVCLAKTSSSCIFTETPLLHVPPPPALTKSRARVPDAWLMGRRRRKMSSWELERLQRLLEHTSAALVATDGSDANVAPSISAGATSGGDAVGSGIDSSTSPTATTTTTSAASHTLPSTHTADLERRLTAQMAQRFSKMEM